MIESSCCWWWGDWRQVGFWAGTVWSSNSLELLLSSHGPQTHSFLILGYWMLIIDRISVLFTFVVKKLVNMKLFSENRLFCLWWLILFIENQIKTSVWLLQQIFHSAHLFMVKVENSSVNKNRQLHSECTSTMVVLWGYTSETTQQGKLHKK